jgi:hypothetical protein
VSWASRLLTERELTFSTFVCPEEIKSRTFPQKPFDLQPWCRSSEDTSRSESDSNSYLSPGSLNNGIIKSLENHSLARWWVQSNLPSACAREFEFILLGQTTRGR